MIAIATHTKITTISDRIFLRKNGTEKLKWQEEESLKNKSREKRLLFFLIGEFSFLKMRKDKNSFLKMREKYFLKFFLDR